MVIKSRGVDVFQLYITILNLINHTPKTAQFVPLHFWPEYVLDGNLTGIEPFLL
jgi:hypothetical protein